MKDRPDDPSHHERTLLPRSYISLLVRVTGMQYLSCLESEEPPEQQDDALDGEQAAQEVDLFRRDAVLYALSNFKVFNHVDL